MIRRREYKNSGNYDLTVRATNTTNSVIQMNILGNPTYTNDIANQFIQYQWDITSFAFSIETTIYLQYRKVGASTYQLAVVQLPSQDTQGIVDALNSLNLASFYSSTSGGNTFINTYNDTYEFGILNIYYPSIIDPTFLYGIGFSGGGVDKISIQTDNKILVAGGFTNYQGVSANSIIRLNTDGFIDNTFIYGVGFDNNVYGLSIQQDGKILVVGSFNNYNLTPANGIIRLNSDGSVDNTLVYGTGFNGIVFDIKIQSDGKILVVGNFSTYNGIPISFGIVRLLSNGTIDATFIAGTGFAGGIPQEIQIQNDGSILVGGVFSSYNGTPQNGIVRILSNGTLDTFTVGTGITFGGQVNTIFIQSDNKILVGGQFTDYNGTPANNIIRLNNNGTIDTTFNYGTGISGFGVTSIIQNNNKIYVGGSFSNYDGTNVNNFTRLNDDGSIDTTYNTGTEFDLFVLEISAQQNNNVIIGGGFTSFDGVSANRIIRLLPS